MRELTGVLPDRQIKKLFEDGCISRPYRIRPDKSIQPASLDLHLGQVAYRLRSSFTPGDGKSVKERLAELSMGEVNISTGGVLEANRPYLIPLHESLDLPSHLHAKANPKSSTGRVDVFARLVSDYSYQFDEVAVGYSGPLYLEVYSNTFTIRVREGLSLNQLRFVAGNPQLSDGEIMQANDEYFLTNSSGFYVSNGFFVGLDLSRNQPIGYRAKRNSRLLDLSDSSHLASHYWESVHVEADNRLVLEPSEFYLLMSEERVRIPHMFAAEMVPYDAANGELRTHYAGFFDPGFNSRAALEVRVRDVPFMVEHGQRICKFTLEYLSEPPDRLYDSSIGSHYQGQSSALSKHFTGVSGIA